MKVIISTGIGKLHLIDTAASAQCCGCETVLIAGWAPVGWQLKLANLIGRLVGERDLSKRLIKRRPQSIPSTNIVTCSLSDLMAGVLNWLAKKKVLNPSKAQKIGFQLFGWQSRCFIKDANIFHVRSGAGQGGAIYTAKKGGMKVVVDHSIAHPNEIKKLLEAEYENHGLALPWEPDNPMWAMVLKDCSEADYLQVNSDYVATTFIQEGYPPDKIKVIYLGVRDDFIGLKKRYDIEGPLKLLFVGPLDLRKGARVMFEALKLLCEQGINWELHVVGSGQFAKGIMPSELRDRILFHGFLPQDELKKFYSEADLFVFPTFAEGSARCAMEAMAAGLPVITTTNCGAPITHRESGFYIDVGNPVTLADAIVELADNDTMRKELGTQASKLISEEYLWDHYGHNLVEFYNEVIEKES